MCGSIRCPVNLPGYQSVDRSGVIMVYGRRQDVAEASVLSDRFHLTLENRKFSEMCDLSQLGPNQIRIRDGRIVPFREIQPSDAERLQQFHRDLSERSRYQRFMWHYPELTDAQAQRFTTVDQIERVALVAIDPEDPGDPYWRSPTRPRSWHNRRGVCSGHQRSVATPGLGTELSRKVLDRAMRLGIRTVYAIVLPENRPMIELLQHLGIALSRTVRRPFSADRT